MKKFRTNLKTEETNERKIGEVFEDNGIKLKCVKRSKKMICEKCYFIYLSSKCLQMTCTSGGREDKKSVIFVKVDE